MSDRTLTVRLRAVTSEYTSAMAGASRSTAALGASAETSMAKAGGSTQALTSRLGGLKGAAAQLAATGIGVGLVASLDSAADSFAKAGRETMKFQRVTGATAEDASRLRVVAQQTGVDVDKLGGAFVKLSKTQDTSKGQAALSALGVSLKDANGEALPLPEQLKRVAEGVANTGDAATRNRALVDLFGKSGADLGPLLGRGADGIDKLIKKSDEYGLTLSSQNLDSVKKYTAAQRDMTLAWQGFQTQVGSEVLPVLAEGLSTVAGVAGNVAKAFAGLPEPLKQGAVGMAGLSGAALVLFGGGGLMLRGLSGATAGWKSFAGSVGQAGGAIKSLNLRNAEGDLTRLGVAAKIASGAIATIAVADVAFSALNDGSGVANRAADALTDLTVAREKLDQKGALKAFGDAVGAEQDTLRLQNLWQEFGAEVEIVGTGVKADVEQVQRSFDSMDPKNQQAALDALKSATAQLDPNSRQHAINTEFIKRNQESLEKKSAAQKADTDATSDASAKAAELKDVTALLDAKVSDLSTTFQANQAAAKGWADGFSQTAGLYNDATDAAQGVGAAFHGLNEVAGSLPKNLSLAAASQGKYTDEQNKAIDAWQQVGTAIQAQLGGLLALGTGTDAVRFTAAAYEQQLRRQLETMGVTDKKAQDYYITLAGLDGQSVETSITLSGAEQARQQLQLLQGNFDTLPAEKRSAIYAKIAQNDWVGAKAIYDSLQSKTVDVTLQTKYTAEGVTADATARRQGRIPDVYRRAVGGPIPFVASGTDTVPAMLTPGEYVLRKAAVDRLGVPFLDKMNRSAGQSLAVRHFANGGHVDSSARFVSVTAVNARTSAAGGTDTKITAAIQSLQATVAGLSAAAGTTQNEFHWHEVQARPSATDLVRALDSRDQVQTLIRTSS